MTRPRTTAEVAELLSVSIRTVEALIASGELGAINVSRDRASRKPRIRITQAALDAFLASRAIVPAGQPTPRPQRRRQPQVPSYI